MAVLGLKTEYYKSEQGLTYVNATGSTLVAGTPILSGGIVGICQRDIANGKMDELQIKGRVRARKKNETWAVTDLVGWDANGDPYLGVAGTGAWTKVRADWDAGYIGGRVERAAAATDEQGYFYLNEFAEAGQVSSPTVGLRIVTGQHTTIDANDTVVTGLNTVTACGASLNDDPVDGAMYVTADPGDQAGAPAAGSIMIKTWLNTDADATHAAATTFTKKISWWAAGT